MEINVSALQEMKKSQLQQIFIQVIAGLVLFLLPNFLPNSIFKIIGFVSIVLGIVVGYITFKRPKEYMNWKSYLIPIAIVIAGLFVLIQTEEALTIVALAIGVTIIIKGIGVVFLKENPIQNPRYKIFGLISIGIGISVMMFSSNIGSVFSYYIGIILFYHAVIDILIFLDLNQIIKSANGAETIIINKVL